MVARTSCLKNGWTERRRVNNRERCQGGNSELKKDKKDQRRGDL